MENNKECRLLKEPSHCAWDNCSKCPKKKQYLDERQHQRIILLIESMKGKRTPRAIAEHLVRNGVRSEMI